MTLFKGTTGTSSEEKNMGTVVFSNKILDFIRNCAQRITVKEKK